MPSFQKTATPLFLVPSVLDGLTIGSDHCFDMSLGLGGASIEEGEVGISELATSALVDEGSRRRSSPNYGS